MRYILFMILTASLFTTGCKEKLPLEDKVMQVHDAVMPKMANLDKAKKDLRAILDSTSESQLKDTILTTISYLEKAGEGMLVWMDEYELPNKETEKQHYLEKELIRIQKVSDDMLNSLAQAKKIIESHEE